MNIKSNNGVKANQFNMKVLSILERLTNFLLILFTVSSAYAASVINQIHHVSADDLSILPNPFPSQIFSDFPLSSSMVLEDFAVTNAELKITKVSALFRAINGFDSFQDVTSIHVSVFDDLTLASTTLEGNIANEQLSLAEAILITKVVDGSGTYEYGRVDIEIVITLPTPGKYWIGIAPEATSDKQFFLQSATPAVSGGQNAQFANPGGGFAVDPLLNVGHDASYAITAVPEPSSLTYSIVFSLSLCLYRRRSSEFTAGRKTKNSRASSQTETV